MWIQPLCNAFFGSFITYLVVFNLYLAIIMKKKIKRVKRRRKKIINFDKKWIRARGVPECG